MTDYFTWFFTGIPTWLPPAVWQVARRAMWTLVIVTVTVQLFLIGFFTYAIIDFRGLSNAPLEMKGAAIGLCILLLLVRSSLQRRLVRAVRSGVNVDDGKVCLECGYALTGLAPLGVCPECGMLYDTNDVTEIWSKSLDMAREHLRMKI